MQHHLGRRPGTAVAAVLLLAALAAAPACARDWNRTDDPLLDGVGLHAGKIGGVGLSFKFPLRWWLYGQATGGIWHTADNKRHNAGFEVQYLLRQDRTLRLFVAGGLGYFYHQERQAVLGGDDLVTTRHSLNTGFGIGAEMLRSERFSVQVEADFTHEGRDGSVTVFPQVGAYFYF
ncbi:MAG: hypothetical protein ACYDIE_08550 [Candidatus Krumholzibacteriia bacterium]